MLVADPDGERHGDDAAGERRPESVQELLVVVEKDDELVAALRAERLQVMQDPERAGVDLSEAYPPLGVLPLDIGDDAVDIAIRLQQLHQSLVRHRDLYRHHEIGAWAQIDLRLELDGPVVGPLQAKAARHPVHVDQHLEHRHVLADAVARADGERDVGEAMPLLGIDAGEALGLEFLRIAPELRVPMQHIGADEHIGPGADRVAPDLIGLDRAPGEQPARRIEPAAPPGPPDA